ncbi:MAG: hypothetical protein V9F00_17515 [Nocardioides sp.]
MSKWASFVIALIVSKVVLVVIFLLATAQVSAPIDADLQSVSDPIAGVVLMLIAGFAPYLTYKAISFMGFDMYHAMSAEQEAKSALNRPLPIPMSRRPGAEPSKVLDGGSSGGSAAGWRWRLRLPRRRPGSSGGGASAAGGGSAGGASARGGALPQAGAVAGGVLVADGVVQGRGRHWAALSASDARHSRPTPRTRRRHQRVLRFRRTSPTPIPAQPRQQEGLSDDAPIASVRDYELAPVKFSRLTRRGVLLGLSGSQLVVVGLGAIVLVFALYFGGGPP